MYVRTGSNAGFPPGCATFRPCLPARLDGGSHSRGHSPWTTSILRGYLIFHRLCEETSERKTTTIKCKTVLTSKKLKSQLFTTAPGPATYYQTTLTPPVVSTKNSRGTLALSSTTTPPAQQRRLSCTIIITNLQIVLNNRFKWNNNNMPYNNSQTPSRNTTNERVADTDET